MYHQWTKPCAGSDTRADAADHSMQKEIVERLLALNREFYHQFASPFAETRKYPQPGFDKLIKFIPQPCPNMLDVGCGEGRFGHFVFDRNLAEHYTGVDFSQELIDVATKSLDGEFFLRDLSRPGCLDGLGEFNLIACLATLQHIPGQSNRLNLLQEMRGHLAAGGVIMLSNWQFLDSNRQRRKITDWSQVNLNQTELEENDYLIAWQRDGTGYRYVHFVSPKEMERLAKSTGLKVVEQFRADGREGNLNLYSVLSAG
jgi:2-polyprenyl-3-methyl-5-hydroxy-6-metoxy-1,4-benzoquinol methylase